jgi:hypothetical protein
VLRLSTVASHTSGVPIVKCWMVDRAPKTIGRIKALCVDGIDGGTSSRRRVTPLPQLSGTPLRWSDDGRFVFVRRNNLPVEIDRVEIATGRPRSVEDASTRDMVGVDRIFPMTLTLDGKSYCYSATRNLSDLFVVEGVR